MQQSSKRQGQTRKEPIFGNLSLSLSLSLFLSLSTRLDSTRLDERERERERDVSSPCLPGSLRSVVDASASPDCRQKEREGGEGKRNRKDVSLGKLQLETEAVKKA